MDPIRMIEAIVAGITFLGAGTIIRQKSGIEGLTTAAALLYVAALGVTVALSQFALAIGLTLLNLLILRGIKLFERHFLNGYDYQQEEGEKEQVPHPNEQDQEIKHQKTEDTIIK
jgi:uncharacterized membrane protein YhiD involved in acid resistance